MHRKLTRQRWTWLTVGLIAGAALIQFWPAATLRAGAQAEKQTQPDDKNDGTLEATNRLYAEAYAKLAHVQLRDALNANKREIGTFSSALIERLKQHAKVADLLVERAKHPNEVNLSNFEVMVAEGRLKIAEVHLQTALQLQKRIPDAESNNDIEQLQLTVAVAKLHLQQARLMSGKVSQLANLQWQLNQVRDDVLNLSISYEANALVR